MGDQEFHSNGFLLGSIKLEMPRLEIDFEHLNRIGDGTEQIYAYLDSKREEVRSHRNLRTRVFYVKLLLPYDMQHTFTNLAYRGVLYVIECVEYAMWRSLNAGETDGSLRFHCMYAGSRSTVEPRH